MYSDLSKKLVAHADFGSFAIEAIGGVNVSVVFPSTLAISFSVAFEQKCCPPMKKLNMEVSLDLENRVATINHPHLKNKDELIELLVKFIDFITKADEKKIHIGNKGQILQRQRDSLVKACIKTTIENRKAAFVDVQLFTDNQRKNTFADLAQDIDVILYNIIASGCDFEMLDGSIDDTREIGYEEGTYSKPNATVRFIAIENDSEDLEEEINLMIAEILKYAEISNVVCSIRPINK